MLIAVCCFLLLLCFVCDFLLATDLPSWCMKQSVYTGKSQRCTCAIQSEMFALFHLSIWVWSCADCKHGMSTQTGAHCSVNVAAERRAALVKASEQRVCVRSERHSCSAIPLWLSNDPSERKRQERPQCAFALHHSARSSVRRPVTACCMRIGQRRVSRPNLTSPVSMTNSSPLRIIKSNLRKRNNAAHFCWFNNLYSHLYIDFRGTMFTYALITCSWWSLCSFFFFFFFAAFRERLFLLLFFQFKWWRLIDTI